MGRTLTRKLIDDHLTPGIPEPGATIGLSLLLAGLPGAILYLRWRM